MLAALLFGPFAIKLMVTEPYPAVIMPSGSGRIEIGDNTFTFRHYRAYGITQAGAKEALDLVDFIQPAHPQYLYEVFRNQFGLKNGSTKTIKIRGTNLTVASYPQRGATVRNQTKYRSSLNAHFDNRYEHLLLEQVTVVGELKTRRWIKESIDEINLIEL